MHVRGAGGVRARAATPAAASCAACQARRWLGREETEGVFDTPALEGLASKPGSGQPELGPERPEGLFDVFAPTEPG
jgi:hypothetical protein